jgi:XRE family transcriptional regulator, aerobic/anaerobic benzoate catabolism transcriptional regulator
MLFEVYGQATFRRYERETLEKIAAGHEAAVIAASGGIVAEDETYALLRATTDVVWLRGRPGRAHAARHGTGRLPPSGENSEAMKDLVAILEAREAEYGRAHAQLDTLEEDGRGVLERARGNDGQAVRK